jgi:hypothetical protein
MFKQSGKNGFEFLRQLAFFVAHVLFTYAPLLKAAPF